LVCAFAIPSTAPIQEKRRSKKEHAAISAREIVDLASLERAAPLMAWFLNIPYFGIIEEGDGG
jgi:hypothetical protein